MSPFVVVSICCFFYGTLFAFYTGNVGGELGGARGVRCGERVYPLGLGTQLLWFRAFYFGGVLGAVPGGDSVGIVGPLPVGTFGVGLLFLDFSTGCPGGRGRVPPTGDVSK